MSTDTFMTKRRARYKGEMGFFADNEMSEEDIRPVTLGEQVIVTWYQPENVQQRRYLYGLVYKTWQNTSEWLDHHVLMDELKTRVGYLFKGKPKSTKRISNNELRFLTDRIMDVIAAEILPGINRDDLRREVEEMLGDKREEH